MPDWTLFSRTELVSKPSLEGLCADTFSSAMGDAELSIPFSGKGRCLDREDANDSESDATLGTPINDCRAERGNGVLD